MPRHYLSAADLTRAEAEALLERALQLYEAAFGPNHPAVAEALLGLGAAHLGRGRPEAAEAELARAVALLGKRGAATDEAAEASRLLAEARAARVGTSP